MKKPKLLKLHLRTPAPKGGSHSPANGHVYVDDHDNIEGYFLGDFSLNGINFHIEAIETKVVSAWPNGVLRSVIRAVNADFQNRIDNYNTLNESMLPSLVKIGKKDYFIHIEPFAQ